MGFDDPAADGRPMSALTDGQIHDSAAEVVDAPLLILRIAQSRAETTRLIDWLRGMGARITPSTAAKANALLVNNKDPASAKASPKGVCHFWLRI